MDMEDFGDYFLHRGRIKIWKHRILELPEGVVGPVVQALNDFGQNVTTYDQFHFRASLKPYVALWIIIYSLIFSFGIFLNYKLIQFIKRNSRKMCFAHAFLFHLFLGNGMNDLLIKDLIVLPVSFIMMTGVHWVLGRVFCKLFPIVQDSCFYSSSIILLCAFYSRYKDIAHSSFNSCTHVIEYQEALRKKSSIPVLLGCFVVAHIAIIPHTVYITFVDFGYYFGPGFAGTGVCTLNITNHIVDYVKYLFIFFYVIPVVLSLSYYFKTVDIIDKWVGSAEDFLKTKRINIHRGSTVETSSFLNTANYVTTSSDPTLKAQHQQEKSKDNSSSTTHHHDLQRNTTSAPMPFNRRDSIGAGGEGTMSRKNSLEVPVITTTSASDGISNQMSPTCHLERTDSKRRRVDFHSQLTQTSSASSKINSPSNCDNAIDSSSSSQQQKRQHPFENHRSSIRRTSRVDTNGTSSQSKKKYVVNDSIRGRARRRRRTLAAINEELSEGNRDRVGARGRNQTFSASVRYSSSRNKDTSPVGHEQQEGRVVYPTTTTTTTGRQLPDPRRSLFLQPPLSSSGHRNSTTAPVALSDERRISMSNFRDDTLRTQQYSSSNNRSSPLSLRLDRKDYTRDDEVVVYEDDGDNDRDESDDEDFDDGYFDDDGDDDDNDKDNVVKENEPFDNGTTTNKKRSSDSNDNNNDSISSSDLILLRSNLDLEQLIQKLMCRILIFHSTMLLPFNILRFIRHLVPESPDLTYIYDILFLTLVALQLSTVLLIPSLVLSFFVPEYQKILKSLQEEEQRKEELKRLQVVSKEFTSSLLYNDTSNNATSRSRNNRSSSCRYQDLPTTTTIVGERKGSKDSTRSQSSRKSLLLAVAEGEESKPIVSVASASDESIRMSTKVKDENRLQVTGHHNIHSSPSMSESGSPMRSSLVFGTITPMKGGSHLMLHNIDQQQLLHGKNMNNETLNFSQVYDSSVFSAANQSLKRSLSARVTSGDALQIRRALRDKRTSIATTSSAFSSSSQLHQQSQLQQQSQQHETLTLDTNHLPSFSSPHSISRSPVAPRSPTTTPFSFMSQMPLDSHRVRQHHQLPPIPQAPFMSSHGDVSNVSSTPSTSFQRQTPQRRTVAYHHHQQQRQQPQQPQIQQQTMYPFQQHQNLNASPRMTTEYSTEVRHDGLQGNQVTLLTRPRSSSCFIRTDYRQDHRFNPSNV